MKKDYAYCDDDIPWREREKIRHEINTYYYQRYRLIKVIMHRSVGVDDHYYIYIARNLGFDDYEFIARIPDCDQL